MNKEYQKRYWEKNRLKKRAYDKKYYQENREKRIAKTVRWTERNRERKRAYDVLYRERNGSKRKLTNLRFHLKKYQITVDDYIRISSEQNNLCAICQEKSKLFIDHCHKTGKTRGLLCRYCNSMLGFSKESIERFEKGILYLRKYLDTNIEIGVQSEQP